MLDKTGTRGAFQLYSVYQTPQCRNQITLAVSSPAGHLSVIVEMKLVLIPRTSDQNEFTKTYPPLLDQALF